MKPAIELIKTRDGCAMLEQEPRYNVMLRGVRVAQLYFNTRGYRGVLPLPNGDRLDIGERGISAYRAEVRRLNQEFQAQERGARWAGQANAQQETK